MYREKKRVEIVREKEKEEKEKPEKDIKKEHLKQVRKPGESGVLESKRITSRKIGQTYLVLLSG